MISYKLHKNDFELSYVLSSFLFFYISEYLRKLLIRQVLL